jgi:beta-alanine degradation protein BauB
VHLDPTVTNPESYRVLFENDRVRVLEYRPTGAQDTAAQTPGQHHVHPELRRRVGAGGKEVDVELPAGVIRWVGVQEHYGENIGETRTHAIFVELKESDPSGYTESSGALRPSGA